MGILTRANFGSCDSCYEKNIMIKVIYIGDNEIDLCDDCTATLHFLTENEEDQ